MKFVSTFSLFSSLIDIVDLKREISPLLFVSLHCFLVLFLFDYVWQKKREKRTERKKFRYSLVFISMKNRLLTPRLSEEHFQHWHYIRWQFYRPSFVVHRKSDVVEGVEFLKTENNLKLRLEQMRNEPSFSSTRSLMRSILSVASMSISISFPVSVFTLIIIFTTLLFCVTLRFLKRIRLSPLSCQTLDFLWYFTDVLSNRFASSTIEMSFEFVRS